MWRAQLHPHQVAYEGLFAAGTSPGRQQVESGDCRLGIYSAGSCRQRVFWYFKDIVFVACTLFMLICAALPHCLVFPACAIGCDIESCICPWVSRFEASMASPEISSISVC